MKLIITTLILFFSSTCFTQISLTGKVIDEQKNAIPFANIILLLENNRFYKGAISDENGNFTINAIIANKYTLKISFIGYKEITKPLKIDSYTTLKTIILKEDTETLDTIEITAKRPTVKRKIDRLVFNVENTILSSGNAWDVLKKTPALIVRSDNLLIKNSSNIIILINDKRVHLSNSELKNLLESTSASDITSVEVITNPPAKYEAEGSSVLNIKMKKNLVTGYKATLGGSFKKARYARGSFFTSQYYKNNWLNLYANYNNNRGSSNRLQEEFINFSNANSNELFHSNLDRNTFYKTHNFKVNSEFILNKKSSLTLGGELYYNPNRKVRNITNSKVLLANNSIKSSFLTLNNSRKFTKKLSLNTDYEIRFNKKSKLNVTGYYTDYKNNRNQIVNTDFLDKNNQLNNTKTLSTKSNQSTNIYSGQADYKKIINDASTFEIGTKYASINSLSELQHFNLINNINVLDLTKTNTFKYDEQNIAGYLSYGTSFGKFNIKSGLRVEYTQQKGNSITLRQIDKNNYFKAFPTFYTQYSPNDKHQFGINYGKRISRPNYSSLNPFKFYLADYSYYEGNPKLKPSITDNIEFQYTFKNKYNFEVYHQSQSDYITEINFQNNTTNQLRYSSVNIPKNKNFGCSFNTSLNITDRLSIYMQHNLYKNESIFTALENNNKLIKNSLWGYYGYFSMNYLFLKDKSLTVELSSYLVTDGIQGSMKIEGDQDLSFGLSKTFFKKRASLSIEISDILKTQIVKISTNYLNQDNYYIDNQETQFIRVGFRYNIGNQSLKKKNNNKAIDEQKRL